MKILSILIISALIGVAMSILMQFPFASSEYGFSNGSEERGPDIMSLILYDKFEQVSPNSTKDLYLEFFDENNKTLVKNVSFFVNATKGDTVLIHELFYTHTGIMTLKFSPNSDTGKLVINGTAEPVLGGMMSDNDMIPIEMSAFTPDTYHFHIEALALVDTNHIVDQTHPPTFDSWWSVDDKGNISKYENSTTVSISKIKNESPLQQFKSGVAADNVKCGQSLQLVIKTKDGSPACARPQTAQKLVERKWGWTMQSIDSIKPLPNKITGLENNTGMVTIENQIYYFDTPNYTKTSYIHPVQITFHDVNFTLFPPGFRGGLPIGGCPGQYYWVDAKFADGAAELLHIYAGSQSCADSVPIMLSNHFVPQAGLAFSDGKMRLLVRDENQPGKDIVLQKPSSMIKPFPYCNPSPAKEKLIREKQQILTDALLADEKKHGGSENRTQNLPWSFIGYDCIDNALEVGIPPQYFNSDSLPKYFEKIRSIVGNTIDVVLSPQDYALPL